MRGVLSKSYLLLSFIPFICPFFFLFNKTSSQNSLLVLQPVFKFCVHLEWGQVYCGKEIQDTVINFCLLFPFFLFSNSHSNVIHREICVKDFSGTTVPRILKFRTNVGYHLLYCVKEKQHAAYHSPYLSILLSLQADFCCKSLSFNISPSSNFVYT